MKVSIHPQFKQKTETKPNQGNGENYMNVGFQWAQFYFYFLENTYGSVM